MEDSKGGSGRLLLYRCGFCKVKLRGVPLDAGKKDGGNDCTCKAICQKCADYIGDVQFRSSDRERVCTCGHNLSQHQPPIDGAPEHVSDKMPCRDCNCDIQGCDKCEDVCTFEYCDSVEYNCACDCIGTCDCLEFVEDES